MQEVTGSVGTFRKQPPCPNDASHLAHYNIIGVTKTPKAMGKALILFVKSPKTEGHDIFDRFVSFLAERTYHGRAYATVLRMSSYVSSVCDVMYCG